MHLSFRHVYDGTPDQVVDLFHDHDFISAVASDAGAREHRVNVTGDVTNLDMVLDAPSDVAKFVGKTLNLVLRFRWHPAGSQGERSGDVALDVKGAPVSLDAGCVLRPEGQGTTADYAGDLKVKIPLMGPRVERMVEPFIADAFAGIQRRAQERLRG